jgi:hypothetical protein
MASDWPMTRFEIAAAISAGGGTTVAEVTA